MINIRVYRLMIVLSMVCLVGFIFRERVQAHQLPDPSIPIPIQHQIEANQPRLPTGFQIISSTPTSLLIDIQAPVYRYETASSDNQPCQILKADGYFQASLPGEPGVLSAGVMIGVPLDKTPSYIIRSMDTETLPGQIHLCPVATPLLQKNHLGSTLDQGEMLIKNTLIYSQDSFFPIQPVELAISGMIRSQRVAQLSFMPFLYNPARDELRVVRHITLEIHLGNDAFPATSKDLVNEGVFEALLQKILINYDQALYWRLSQQQIPLVKTTSTLSVPSDQPVYKIQIDQDGIYQVTYSALQSAGIPVEDLDPRTFKLFNQGIEIPVYVSGEGDGIFNPADHILFLGQKITTKFTNSNIYWLSWGDLNGLRIPTQDGSVHGADIPISFRTTLHLEEDDLYITGSPSGPQFDHWYWFVLNAYNGPVSQDFNFSLQDLDVNSPTAMVSGLLKGYYGNLEHHTQIYINGQLIDDHTWPIYSEYEFSIDIPTSYLVEGINTLTVTCPRDGDILYDFQLVNWFEIDYNHTYTAENDSLDFNQPDQWQFQVGGFITSTIDIFEITNPFSPIRILGSAIIPDALLYEINFEQDFSGEHRYLVLSPSSWLTPLAITQDVSADLKDPTNGADYIIISHPDFLDAIQPLATYRAGQGLRVKVVNVQDVYDEFNHGVFDPQALQSFLAYTYAHWISPAPAYVLLVGDGHFDFKDNYGDSGPFYIPPFLGEFDPWIGETPSDNRYVTIIGDDILPDMYIGRFPVNNVTEASSMVNKTLMYEQTPVLGDWYRNLTFVADNADGGGNFPLHSDIIADNYLPAHYTAEKIYYGIPPYENVPDAQAAILNAINQGRLIIHYTGHASEYFWASEQLFGVGNIDTLLNTGIYPLFLPMTCMEGYFIWPNDRSLAESLVRVSDKGAIASFSPTGYGLANGHDLLSQGIYHAFFYQGTTQFGPATTFAKYYLAANGPVHQDLIDTYILFGDPASQLKIQPFLIHIPLVIR